MNAGVVYASVKLRPQCRNAHTLYFRMLFPWLEKCICMPCRNSIQVCVTNGSFLTHFYGTGPSLLLEGSWNALHSHSPLQLSPKTQAVYTSKPCASLKHGNPGHHITKFYSFNLLQRLEVTFGDSLPLGMPSQNTCLDKELHTTRLTDICGVPNGNPQC